uniref:Ubiquitin-conjugating enzyme E2 G2 n=1 Tax=Oryzias sinensis TaxID=183150 RepID=A0A8C7YMI9_9TELE
MAGTALKRLMAEYKQLTLNPPEGIVAGPANEENFFEWEALIILSRRTGVHLYPPRPGRRSHGLREQRRKVESSPERGEDPALRGQHAGRYGTRLRLTLAGTRRHSQISTCRPQSPTMRAAPTSMPRKCGARTESSSTDWLRRSSAGLWVYEEDVTSVRLSVKDHHHGNHQNTEPLT